MHWEPQKHIMPVRQRELQGPEPWSELLPRGGATTWPTARHSQTLRRATGPTTSHPPHADRAAASIKAQHRSAVIT